MSNITSKRAESQAKRDRARENEILRALEAHAEALRGRINRDRRERDAVVSQIRAIVSKPQIIT